MSGEIWRADGFLITEARGGILIGKRVEGFVNGGFGIHEKPAGVWNLTHLATGFRAFAANSEEGAVQLGNYLVRHYAADFAAVTTDGVTVRNAKRINHRLRADAAFKDLFKRFALTNREMNERRLIPDVKIVHA